MPWIANEPIIIITMKPFLKIALALLGLAAMTLSSCNTMAGAGEDIQKAGGALTKSATR